MSATQLKNAVDPKAKRQQAKHAAPWYMRPGIRLRTCVGSDGHANVEAVCEHSTIKIVVGTVAVVVQREGELTHVVEDIAAKIVADVSILDRCPEPGRVLDCRSFNRD